MVIGRQSVEVVLALLTPGQTHSPEGDHVDECSLILLNINILLYI